MQLLHLAALWALAVAQPLLDVLGRNAEFFAIRRSEPEDIVLFAVGLVVLPPLILFAVEALADAADERAGRAVHLLLVGGLCSLIALLILKRAGGSSALLAPMCAVLGAGGAVLYARTEVARSFLTVLAPAPLVVVGVFLFTTPVHKLLSADEAGAALAPDGGRAPVVVLVLDELPLTSLLRGDGRIDARRYPNFAALARDSLWFRNTSSVDAATQIAVPAILTGRRPKDDTLPTAAEQPRNLFTLLGRGRRIHVHESVSDLCPERLCPKAEDAPSLRERMRSLVSDLEVVGLHVLLPDDVRRRLPSIDERWQSFRGASGGDDARQAGSEAGSVFVDIIERKRAADDRPGLFEHFVAGIPRPRRGRPGPLSILHVLLPHVPWEHTPDGRRYRAAAELPGLDFETWSRDAGAALAGFERHLLEVGYLDRLLGGLLRRLRATDSYDDTLLVVTADHGVSLRPGRSRRAIDQTTAQDILPVPLFVKAPGRRRGQVVETHLQTIDILPTVADLLGIRVPWRVDGVSAFSAAADRRTVRATNAGKDPVELDTARLDALRRAALRRQVALLGQGGPPHLRSPAADRLVGRRIGTVAAAPDGASATVDDPVAFAAVDLSAPTIPLHVSGRVRGEAEQVAIALNGRIGAVASVFRDRDDRRFSAMVPRSLLRDGGNVVDVLGISPTGSTPSLVRLGRAGGRESLYVLSGQSIVGPGGRRYRMAGEGLVGSVDRSVRDAGVVHVSGWAARAGSFQPVEQIVGFGDGRLLFSGPPSAARPDVGRAHRVAPEDLGFAFDAVEIGAQRRPQIFALSRGIATPLRWYCADGARQDVGC